MPVDFSGVHEWEARVLGMVQRQPRPGRNAAKNAIHHILAAYRIKDIDPEMAHFRAITGEEEAARSVIHALQRHNYPGASLLKWKNHTHKAAIVPFLSAIGNFAKHLWPTPEIVIDTESGTDIIRIQIPVTLANGTQGVAKPNPPLGLNVRIKEAGAMHDFREEITALLNQLRQHWGKDFKHMLDAVQQRAQERNMYLYATDQGIPYLHGNVEDELVGRRGNVFTCLVAFLLIDMFAGHQQFVLQCLPLLLAMLETLPQDT